MLSSGFFTTLFQQFVTLISAFCIGTVPGGSTPYIAAPDTAPAAAARQQPLVTRVLETQFNAFVDIGTVVARSLDGGTAVVLSLPRNLVNALNRGGVAALPGGVADTAGQAVDVAQNGATDLVQALGDAILAELRLLPGADQISAKADLATADVAAGPDLQQEPLIVRIITVQLDALSSVGGAVTMFVGATIRAILNAPSTVADAIVSDGPSGLAAGLQQAASDIVNATTGGLTRVISSIGDALHNELALIPGASTAGSDPRAALATLAAAPNPLPTGNGVLEKVIRVPLAFGVAGADLVRAGLRATTDITGGYVTATSDVVRAAVNQLTGGTAPGNDQLVAIKAREPQTVAEALAQAPITIRNGYVAAGQDLKDGAVTARRDFRNTLNPRAETRIAASADSTQPSAAAKSVRQGPLSRLRQHSAAAAK